jgi:DNA modification methylase
VRSYWREAATQGAAITESLRDALLSSRRVHGLTHAFYRYPAATSPDIVRELILALSSPEDWILDPFMGGGTTVVESLARGRRAIGFDINKLAVLITRAKTTPLTNADRRTLQTWVEAEPLGGASRETEDDRLANLPDQLRRPLIAGLTALNRLERSPQRTFARCALLRMGQWALESRDVQPALEVLHLKLSLILQQMLSGMGELIESAGEYGIHKSKIVSRRRLLNMDAAGVECHPRLAGVLGEVRLIVTSPPYPGVHVLYHRWQVHGRKETAAPYWIAHHRDGYGPSYYTMGGRSEKGLDSYFRRIRESYCAVRPLLAPGAIVAQLVGFSDAAQQLPMFLNAMDTAGYRLVAPLALGEPWLLRHVPNRRWYVRGRDTDSAMEFLLFHAPSK